MCFCLSLIYKKGGGRNYLEMMLLTRDSLIHKIWKQFIQLNIKNKQANQKMGRRPEWSVFKEDIQMAKRYIKRFSIWLIEKYKSKLQWDYHFTLVRMSIIKKPTNNKFWRGHGEKGTLLNSPWKCKLVQPLCRTIQMFLKKLKSYHVILQSHFWANVQRKPQFEKIYAHQCLLKHYL